MPENSCALWTTPLCVTANIGTGIWKALWQLTCHLALGAVFTPRHFENPADGSQMMVQVQNAVLEAFAAHASWACPAPSEHHDPDQSLAFAAQDSDLATMEVPETSRRTVLGVSAFGPAGLALAACGPAGDALNEGEVLADALAL